MKKCYNCGAEIGFNEAYYLITKQSVKFQKKSPIGFSCENCVEYEGVKAVFKEWEGDTIPESLK